MCVFIGVGASSVSKQVGIFGSAELFVNEYKVLLAERLIKITDYNIDQVSRKYNPL